MRGLIHFEFSIIRLRRNGLALRQLAEQVVLSIGNLFEMLKTQLAVFW